MIKKIKKYTNTNTLVLLGILLGVFFGLFAPELALSQQIIGEIFISFLKMLVVPLVFSSIYVSIVGLGDIKSLKKIGIIVISLYVLTTALAVLSAIIAMNLVPIGELMIVDGLGYEKALEVVPFSFKSMILSFIPTNIFHSLSEASMMPIILFTSLFAIASLHLTKQRQHEMVGFFTGVMDAMLVMAEWVIKLTPIGVFSLISYVVANQGVEVIVNLWKYLLMVIAVLLFHAVITLPSLLFFFTRINPFKYLNAIREAPIMAFSTASSMATLPVSMRVVEEVGGVDKKNASFVLPLGATISMDGTAAYLTIATLYVSHLCGVDLTLFDQLILGVTVVALSVGVAALPSASLVMLIVIFNQFGLALEYIALIVAVDRILDMARTSLNVTSDLVVVKIVDERLKRKSKQ
ncbi:MAG: dicarboxylate/amino acid:cation symporter [Sulfurimonas sp.]|jgi:Na+/H+-dicarboxylate symporter|uniref:dicarboxylate/amino acid:cation symporter n=1 Tax=Sulfurimonas sp. TaxID=2022749 RepID=UPI00262D780C|nr:dicarboxylate/amino acid:cation symporter [Sulfurimonas sp.]MDD3475603.1 dicarboxylate/amino acid:cation symporter [Sulfurimonas sp.]